MISKKDLKEYLRTGATLDKNGDSVNFKSGYQVGGVSEVATINKNNLNEILKEVKKLLTGCPASAFVGLWVHDGVVYVEYSEHVERLSEAMQKGIDRDEFSIWDWMFKREIRTREC